mgnify:FL=1
MAHIGQDLTFSVVFTNTSDVAADPTTVRFFLREGIDGTELEWIYNAAAVEGTHYPVGANSMVKDSTGTYHVIWVSRKAERHTGVWLGAGAINQTSQTTAFVRHSEIEAVDGV